jgi:hypothetical protein
MLPLRANSVKLDMAGGCYLVSYSLHVCEEVALTAYHGRYSRLRTARLDSRNVAVCRPIWYYFCLGCPQ